MANPYFDAAYYLAQNPDLVIAGVTLATAAQHYDNYGAAEGRQPNPWFDPNAYLLANTDLIANGVTLATALDHFTAFGVYEGRLFNNNPDLQPSNFDAAGYARDNADVVKALGIEDIAHLTPGDAHLLMAHYLAHGAAEGRGGAGDAFAEAVAVAPIVVKINGDFTVGTAVNDTFLWTGAAAGDGVLATDAVSINGLAGIDTLKIIHDNSASVTVAEAVVLASVENIAAVLAGDLALEFADGAAVQSIRIEGGNILDVGFLAGAAGAADSLNVSLDGTGTGLVVDGIETINATLGKGDHVYTLTSDFACGDAITFNLAGGQVGNTATVTVESVGSPTLETATVNGAAFSGNLNIVIGGDLQGVHAVVIAAGAGNDVLNATKAADTLTGGAGDDVFEFGALAAGNAGVSFNAAGDEIVAHDVITDFKQGDSIEFDALTAANSADASIGTVNAGVLTFRTGYLPGKSLADIFTDLSMNGGVITDRGLLFDFHGSAYLYVSDGSAADLNDGLIQLTGGVSAADLSFNSNAVVFAAPVV
ncbi:hypothetical protein ACMHYJ_10775 [Castellaniella hirudinis]|uniref:hypothetical protein n=1 Tax=Castellaniella hirudinis TaxID=1144617 RepID=UPI0039C280E0